MLYDLNSSVLERINTIQRLSLVWVVFNINYLYIIGLYMTTSASHKIVDWCWLMLFMWLRNVNDFWDKKNPHYDLIKIKKKQKKKNNATCKHLFVCFLISETLLKMKVWDHSRSFWNRIQCLCLWCHMNLQRYKSVIEGRMSFISLF